MVADTEPVAVAPDWGYMRQRRAAMGLSQARLSSQMGLAQVTVSQWETGKNPPRWEYIRPLSAALGVDPADLMAEVLSHWFPEGEL